VIYLIERDGNNVRRLTRGRSPSWSPDGRHIVFVRGDSIYRIGADGEGRTRIIGDLKGPEVRWSPDGRKLLYTTELRDGTDLWVANRDGTGRVRLLHNTYVNGADWQPGRSD
jgi:Tol biopolymer transport system component